MHPAGVVTAIESLYSVPLLQIPLFRAKYEAAGKPEPVSGRAAAASGSAYKAWKDICVVVTNPTPGNKQVFLS